ncbi:ABC transporter ATP-binding protein [Deinococcus soli (ex Cha et al. 2016)]|uniref:ABC transporter ATP-binding protein n=1 Tax=Deinococcus soli (ex Cha et al. 2016) TaxID=1309411 RepID=A0A0F7JQX0_9DEIO|nr:ABC transporter transmembrane domain-containing protein [Deinococcus soli (ex Cha et al. 2016)]AKH17754.1 ABC transporter ATP-binding protein [Deinococcus soli (ex Cha et al. 2016)]
MFSRPGRAALPLSPDAPRVKRDPRQLVRLLAFARPYRWVFVVGVVATLISSGLNLVFPALFGRLIDASFLKVGSTDTSQLDRTVVALLGIFALSAVFGAAQSFLLSRVGAGVVADLRRAVFAHLLTLSPRFFGEHKTGDLTSRLTSDVGTVQTVTSTALAQLAAQSVSLVGAVALLVTTSPRLSLLTLAVIPLVIGTAVTIGRRIRRVSREVQDAVAGANASAEEAISGVRVVQSFTAEGLEEGRYGQGVTQSFLAALKRARLQALMAGVMSFLTFGALAVVLWYGGRLVMAGSLTPGNLVTFLFYALQVGGTVVALTGVFNQFQEALGASGRIFELLDERSDLPQPAQPAPLARAEGRVSFDGVSFTYDGDSVEGGRAAVLRGVTLDVPAGQVVALVGPSGAGKTTLVNLIPRFWDVTGGTLRVDGRDVRDYALADLRAQVGLVPQETLLFSGSIRENILYGRPGARPDEVEAAARAANAHEFITAFPQGYDTVVGERGVKLSGGQRQRVAIARAILKDPRILILDEATSALDNESEALVQAALERLMQGRTTFVIAHRLSTIRNADRILVMDAGRVTEDGTHAQLLAAGGLYRDLYELQFRAEQDAREDMNAAVR